MLSTRLLIKGENYMKIAAITDDGITISQHFGRAPYYMVLTIENGEILQRNCVTSSATISAPGEGQENITLVSIKACRRLVSSAQRRAWAQSRLAR
jgi:hypothetical protein